MISLRSKAKSRIIYVIAITVLAVSGFVIVKKSLTPNPCVGCGGCTYEPFKGEVYISGHSLDENNELTQVNFTLKGEKRMNLIWINGDNLSERYKIPLDNETIKDTTIFYLFSGEKIKKGSCQPYKVKSLSRIK